MLKNKLIILLSLVFVLSINAKQIIKEVKLYDRHYLYKGTAIKYDKKFDKRFINNKETMVTSILLNRKGNLYFKKINQSEINSNTYLLHGQLDYIDISTNEVVKKVDYEYGRVAGQVIEYNKNGQINKIENIKYAKKNGFTIEYDSTRTKKIDKYKDNIKKSKK